MLFKSSRDNSLLGGRSQLNPHTRAMPLLALEETLNLATLNKVPAQSLRSEQNAENIKMSHLSNIWQAVPASK